jgi:nucleoside 2-deoxyribosyltransferase
MKLIYVSGPYSGPDHDAISANIAAARAVAIQLWELGHAALCPHLNTAHFEVDCRASYQNYIDGDLLMVARCDGVVMTLGWAASRGARIEREYALELGKPVWYYPNLPEKP